MHNVGKRASSARKRARDKIGILIYLRNSLFAFIGAIQEVFRSFSLPLAIETYPSAIAANVSVRKCKFISLTRTGV
jgi:hypothetical protein